MRALLLSASLLVACSDSAISTVSVRLTAGSETTAHPAVVAIGLRPLLCGASIVPTCTGTLIAPRAVLTAAHCVDRPELWSVSFGPRVEGGATVDVAAVRIHPTWSDDDESGIDLAILLLDRPAPTEPIPLATDSVVVDETVTVVGFGATVGSGNSDGVKREGTSTVTEVSAGSFRTKPGPALICNGDSGGPAIAGGSVVGVSVEGDANCTSWSRHEGVAANRAFIDAAMVEAPPSLAVQGDLCARTCTTNDDCPKFHECEEDADGRTRCVLTPLPIGGVGPSCRDGSTCGGDNPCVRTLGSEGCHCLVPCTAPSYRATGGGCSVSAVGH